MKKIYLFFLLFVSSVACATVADTSKTHKFNYNANGGVEGFFRINYNKLNLDNLNTTLSNSIFMPPTTPSISIGGGGCILIGHLILGGEGQTLLPQSKQYDIVSGNTKYTFKNVYGGGYGLFNIGVALVSKAHVLIYPEVGIGAGHIYELTTQTPVDNSFQHNTTSPAFYEKMVNKAFILDPKLCADFFIADSYIVGVCIGYNYMTSNNWKINTNTVTDGPKSNINGIYAGLTVGIGGLSLHAK